MANYLYIKGAEALNSVIVLNTDTFEYKVFNLDALPSIEVLKIFNKESKKYLEDNKNIYDAKGTVAVVNREYDFYGIFRPVETKLKRGIISLSIMWVTGDTIRDTEYSKDISNIQLNNILDITELGLDVLEKEVSVKKFNIDPKTISVAYNIDGYKKLVSKSIFVDTILKQAEDRKIIRISIDTENSKSINDTTGCNKQNNGLEKEINDLNEQKKKLSDKEQIINKREELLDEKEKKLNSISENIAKRGKKLQDIEHKLLLEKTRLDKVREELNIKEMTLNNDEYIVRLRSELKRQVSILKDKIVELDSIEAYHVAELIADITNIFELGHNKVKNENEDIIEILPEYTYELILKSLGIRDCFTVPAYYFAKLSVYKLRYLESSLNDTKYVAIEQIKFNAALDESIIALIRHEGKAVRLMVYKSYGKNTITNEELVDYTIEYGNTRR